jgi:hypothetical protein
MRVSLSHLWASYRKSLKVREEKECVGSLTIFLILTPILGASGGGEDLYAVLLLVVQVVVVGLRTQT